MQRASAWLSVTLSTTACLAGHNDPRSIPPRSERPLFIALDVASSHACVVDNRGRLWCWGDDPATAIGLRPPSHAWTAATRVELEFEVSAVVTSDDRTCVLGTDAEVRCWARTPERPPTSVAWASGAIELTAPLCARFADGSLACANDSTIWHRPPGTGISIEGTTWLDTRGHIFEFDSDRLRDAELGQIAGAEKIRGGCVLAAGRVHCPLIGAVRNQSSPQAYAGILDGVVNFDFDEHDRHGCVVQNDGRVACWAEGELGQWGDGASHRPPAPTTVPTIEGARLVAVAPGLSCAADDKNVACWGNHRRSPELERIRVLDDARALVAHGDRACVTTDDGQHLCWGRGFRPAYESSDLSFTATPSPVAFELGTLVKLIDHCALGTAGELDCAALPRVSASETYCPQERELGDLRPDDVACPLIRRYGPGTATDFDVDDPRLCIVDGETLDCPSVDPRDGRPELIAPTRVVHDPYTQICVIHDGGRVLCWGWGRTRSPVPDVVDFVALVGDDHHRRSCALRATGVVWCWAADDTPAVELDTPPVVTIEATERFGRWDPDRLWIVTRDGRAGSVATTDARNPEWLECDEVIELAAGRSHVCVRQVDGVVTCLGDNDVGQLGAPPGSYMSSPVRIDFE